MTGYKSVLKGLLSALMTSFQITHLPDYDSIVGLYCELLTNQPVICHQFWENDYHNESLRSLFETAQMRFPLIQFTPFLQILKALSADVDSARTIFVFLKVMNSIDFGSFSSDQYFQFLLYISLIVFI